MLTEDVVDNVEIGKGTTTLDMWKHRAQRAEKKLESLEYVVAFANDLVEMWPTVTMRTLWKVTEKIAFLKDALKQANNG